LCYKPSRGSDWRLQVLHGYIAMKRTDEVDVFDSGQREALLQNDGLYTRSNGDLGLITHLIRSVAVLKSPIYRATIYTLFCLA